jgi:hypothetical protein
LPLFDFLWIDALQQLRVFTPYQASEIHAGRGAHLLVGKYAIQSALANSGYAQALTAIDVSTLQEQSRAKKPCKVQLVVKRCQSASIADEAVAKLQSLLSAFAEIKSNGIARLQAAGADESMLWTASEATDGVPLGELVACSGRLTPSAAMDTSRQMVAALQELHQAGIVHGDISARSVWLNPRGEVRLTDCGLRSVMESIPGGSVEAIPLEAFDYLAPERVQTNTPPTIGSDIYACGCLWWQLLAGRPPLVGGDRMRKLESVSRPKIPSIRRIAPETPEALASAIEACTQFDPALRPASFSDLAKQLGSPMRRGNRRLATMLAASGHTLRRGSGWKAQLRWQHAGQPILATVACLFLLAAATWPLWRSHHPANRQPGSKELPIAQVDSARTAARPQHTSGVATAATEPRDIRQVNYQVVDEASTPAAELVTAAKENPMVELACDTEINGATLHFSSGTTVRGIRKQRPQIVTPPNGLIVAADNIRFENVDFIWRERAEEINSPERHALVDVRAGHAEFIGCTFQAVSAGTFELPVAIRLSDPRAQRGAALAPAVRVRLEHTALQGVACAIDCRLKGPAAIGLYDVLHLGGGPLIRFSQGRPADGPTTINMEHVTARGVSAVLQFDDDETTNYAGAITLTATACVFAPGENGALICCSGQRSLGAVSNSLKSLEWAGQDSLVSPDTAVAIWQHQSKNETAPEADLALDGLVAAAFDFAGPASANSSSSRIQRWLAPQKTDKPPGIGDAVPNFPSVGRRSGQF